MSSTSKKPVLISSDYQRGASALSVDVPTIQAVTKVESGGQGFTADGRLVIRYEPHIFSKYTNGRFDKAYPKLSYPKWVPGYPRSIDHSYQLMAQATKLDAYAAGLSCSYGLFQIMGFNFSVCGKKTFKEFYLEMEKGEGAQLDLFCRYIELAGLADELQAQDWESFARQYNGKQYKKNEYDTKLLRWYNYFKRLENPQQRPLTAFLRHLDEGEPALLVA